VDAQLLADDARDRSDLVGVVRRDEEQGQVGRAGPEPVRALRADLLRGLRRLRVPRKAGGKARQAGRQRRVHHADSRPSLPARASRSRSFTARGWGPRAPTPPRRPRPPPPDPPPIARRRWRAPRRSVSGPRPTAGVRRSVLAALVRCAQRQHYPLSQRPAYPYRPPASSAVRRPHTQDAAPTSIVWEILRDRNESSAPHDRKSLFVESVWRGGGSLCAERNLRRL